MQTNQFLLLKKLKNTESAQLWRQTVPVYEANSKLAVQSWALSFFLMFSIIKNDFLVFFFSKLITSFCTSPI